MLFSFLIILRKVHFFHPFADFCFSYILLIALKDLFLFLNFGNSFWWKNRNLINNGFWWLAADLAIFSSSSLQFSKHFKYYTIYMWHKWSIPKIIHTLYLICRVFFPNKFTFNLNSGSHLFCMCDIWFSLNGGVELIIVLIFICFKNAKGKKSYLFFSACLWFLKFEFMPELPYCFTFWSGFDYVSLPPTQWQLCLQAIKA